MDKMQDAFDVALAASGFDKPGYLSHGEKVWILKGFEMAWQAIPATGQPHKLQEVDIVHSNNSAAPLMKRPVQATAVLDANWLGGHLEKIRGAAHAGAMIGHSAAYKACLEIDAAVSRISQEMRTGKPATSAAIQLTDTPPQ